VCGLWSEASQLTETVLSFQQTVDIADTMETGAENAQNLQIKYSRAASNRGHRN